MPPELLIEAIVAGLLLGCFYAAMSIGLSVAFGLLDDFTVCTAERFLERSVRPLGSAATERVPVLSRASAAHAPAA